MMQMAAAAPIDGLWVLLVNNEGELAAQDAAGRVPVMCRAGNEQTYLLVFKKRSGAGVGLSGGACVQ